MAALDISLRFVKVLIFTTHCLCPVIAYNCLIVGGDGAGSHYYVIEAIGKELAHRGNNVKVIVSDMYADSAKKRDGAQLLKTHIYKSLVTKEQHQNLMTRMVEVSLNGDFIAMLEVADLAIGLAYDQCESVLIDTDMIDLLRQEKIDLIIGDIWYICVGIIAEALDAPFASLSPPAVTMSLQGRINAYPTNPAYIPESVTGLDTKMSFVERVKNTLFLCTNMINEWRQTEKYDQLKLKYNIKPEISTSEALSKAELFFINTHFAFDFPRPFPPHVVPVGGLTTKPAKSLNKVTYYVTFVFVA